jgi:hypothetical protein
MKHFFSVALKLSNELFVVAQPAEELKIFHSLNSPSPPLLLEVDSKFSTVNHPMVKHCGPLAVKFLLTLGHVKGCNVL